MKMWTLLMFFISFNVSGYIIANLVAMGVLMGNSQTMPYTTTDITNQFSLTSFSVQNITYGLIGAGIAGLFGLITKQGGYAVIAALVWVVGIFLNIFNWILNGFPTMINILLAGTGLEFVGYIVQGFFLIIFFFELAGILAEREFTRTQ